MATVHFTSQLERFVKAPSVTVEGGTLKDVLSAVFQRHPELKGYIVDDQGAVRKHVAVFVDGQQIRDRGALGVPVRGDSEIYVFQALSGG